MNINRVNCFDRPLQFRVCHSGSPAKGANGNIRARLNIIPEVISKDELKEYVNDHCEEKKKNGPLISVTPEIEAAFCVPLPCLLCLPCPVIIGAHHHVACHSKFDKDVEREVSERKKNQRERSWWNRSQRKGNQPKEKAAERRSDKYRPVFAPIEGTGQLVPVMARAHSTNALSYASF
ncbi:hypothetical protein BDZ45DRAFT_725559 [Acephala macrosclerotiorum]|nr:hypothetical protein BDZ45DRAFT_725559 [Acephala macrosclerotiorum]